MTGPVIYAWGPGGIPLLIPEEAGVPVGGIHGIKSFMVDTHFSNVNLDTGNFDCSGVRIYMTTAPRLYTAGVLSAGDYYLSLFGSPVVGEGDELVARHRFVCDCSESYFGNQTVNVFSVFQHM